MGSKCTSQCCEESATETTLDTYHETLEYENTKEIVKDEKQVLIMKYKTMKEYDEQTVLSRLNEFQTSYGESHEMTAEGNRDAGAYYLDKENFSKALEYLERSLKTYKELKGDYKLNLAYLYNSLGLAYKYQGSFLQSQEYFNLSFDLYKSIYGENNEITVVPLSNLGVLYQEMLNYNKAKDYSLRVLKVREELGLKTEPDLAFSYNNLGALYEGGLGDLKEAKNYYEKSLKIREEYFGTKDKNTEVSYNNVANVSQDLNEVERSYDQSLAGIGLEHKLSKLIYYHNIGVLYLEKGNLSKAEEFLKKSLSEKTEVLGGSHGKLFNTMVALSTLYRRKEDYKSAEDILDKTLKIVKEFYGEKDGRIGEVYYGLSEVYQGLRNWAKAKEFSWKAYNLGLEVFGPEHWRTCKYWKNLL